MELELISQLDTIYDRYWVIYQWWTSITIGILLVAHFASDRLNLLTTLFIAILYCMYSVWLYGMLVYNLKSAGAAIADLRNLIESGNSEYAISSVYTQAQGNGVDIGVLAAIVMFIGALSYLMFRYLQHRKGST